jgi:hypothetical protein
MHFEAIPTPKSRTPKQNAQESQIFIIKAPIIIATTTKIKAKGRVLSLERWYQRLGHLNHADVK